MKTLEQIINKEQERRSENGMFGIRACKEAIIWERDFCKKSLYQQLEEYVDRANKDCLFNDRMVLACWELINEK